MKFSSELLKGTTKAIILAALADGDKYGYQIIKYIKHFSEDTLALGEGTIYPILHFLEKNKILESYWTQQEALPPRKYYKLTDKGRELYKSSKQEWEQFSDAINKVFLGVKFVLA